LLAEDLQDAILNTAKFAAGLTPVEILSSLPVSGNYQGRTVFLTTDNKLYRSTGAVWSTVVDAADLPNGSITATKIGDGEISTPKLAANAVTADKIGAGEVVAGKLAANAVTAGTIQAGAISAAQIAAGEINGTHMAATEIISMSAQLGTAVVGTLNVLDGAINGVKIEDLAASNSAGATSASASTLGVALTVTGKPVTIIASVQYVFGSTTPGLTQTAFFNLVSSGVTLQSLVATSTVDDLGGYVTGSTVYTFTPSAGAKDFFVTGAPTGSRISIWVIENRK
jgi:hypothetical protein